MLLEALLRKEIRTAEEKRLTELLTFLIEGYEEMRLAPLHPVARSTFFAI